MHYLVTGGAGYVGSHAVRALLDAGHEVTILDNFSTGHRWACQGCPVLEVDLRNPDHLDATLAQYRFDGVLHFAAKSLVGESRDHPLLYWRNNVTGSANLVEAMVRHRIPKLVFSSTAAVFGNPLTDVIDESHPTAPINVYGDTKLAVEKLLVSVCASGSLSAVCLRYFNAAGANNDNRLGEWHEPETHLIPNALRAATGSGPELKVFGTDYPTPDGTCVRDYIHVDDLATAHLLALDSMTGLGEFDVFNLGNGAGFSVFEVIRACEAAAGKPIPYTIGPRREGDPARLVASATKAAARLGWQPRHTRIDTITTSAWAWEQYRASELV